MKCQCDAAGLCKRRGCEVSKIHFARCKRGQVATIDRLYDFTPSSPARKGKSYIPAQKYKYGVGSCLKTRIHNLLSIKAGGTCGCNTLARKMDIWGPDECEARREYIVDRLMENKAMLVDALSGSSWLSTLAGWVIGSSFSDPILRTGANWLLSEAIKESREKSPKKKEVVKTFRSKVRHRGGPFSFTTGPIRFISSQQFQEDIKLLLSKIPPDITAIAGVARSGLSAATMLSMYLHLPMITIRQTMNDIVPTGNGWRLGGSRHVDPSGKILVVDDTVMTGNSLRAINQLVKRELGDSIYASVYCNPNATRKPDIWAVDLPWPHLLEWNIFNSILSPSLACDFDGILCRDCPPGSDDDGERYLNFINNAQPLYVPRRAQIPLIVTARIEKYREPTEQWLRRHRINWHRLVMHPAKTLAERQRDDIPAFKARHFREWAVTHRPAPGPIIFMESEDWQARKIGKQAKMLCVCPSTCGVYSGST